jgi:hypothetical protein
MPTRAIFSAPTLRRRSGALAVAAALGLGLAAPARANVIFNPSFARGLEGWKAVAQAKGALPGYPHILALKRLAAPLRRCDRAQRGHPFLQLNVPAGAAAYVEQGIIVPVHPRRLRFVAWGGRAPVKVVVSIRSGPFGHRLLTFAPPALLGSPTGCSKLRPRTVSLKVGGFAGQAVALRIRATSQGSEAAFADFTGFEL